LAKEGTKRAREKLDAFHLQMQMNLTDSGDNTDIEGHWQKRREAFEAAAQADIEAATLEKKARGCAEAVYNAYFPGFGGYPGSDAQATNGATFTFNATTLTGESASTQISQSSSVGVLKDKFRRKFNISPEKPFSINYLAEKLGPDSVELQSLDCLRPLAGKNSMLAVNVVILSLVKVKRHIYNARGGAPPRRGSYLTSTEEVELDPTMTIGDQMYKIVPGDGAGKGMGKMKLKFALHALIWHSEEVPRKWGEDDGSVTAEPEQLGDNCAQLPEIFANGGKSIVILIPMRGMD